VIPATTCLATMALACSGVKLSRVPSGSLAKASSDGAKMVTASTPFKVSTRPRSLTTLTKVVNAPAPTATSTTSPRSAVLTSIAGGAGASAAGTIGAGAGTPCPGAIGAVAGTTGFHCPLYHP